MAATINGVVCQEIVRDFSEEFDLLDTPVTVKGWLCPWANRYQVVIGLLGLTQSVSVGSGITLNVPLQYPEIPSLYAHHVRIEPVGRPTQGMKQIQWEQCIVWCHYQAVPWSFSGIDNQQLDPSNPFIYAEQTISYSTEWLTVPGKSVYYNITSPISIIDQDYSFPYATVDINISLKQVPFLPYASTIVNALSKPLNSQPFLGFAGNGFLMFLGMQNRASRNSDGSVAQELNYQFKGRVVAPWDYVWYGKTGQWVQAVSITNASLIPQSDIRQVIPSVYWG